MDELFQYKQELKKTLDESINKCQEELAGLSLDNRSLGVRIELNAKISAYEYVRDCLI